MQESNVEKLRTRINKMVEEDGLVDIKVTMSKRFLNKLSLDELGPDTLGEPLEEYTPSCNEEEFAGELLSMLDAPRLPVDAQFLADLDGVDLTEDNKEYYQEIADKRNLESELKFR